MTSSTKSLYAGHRFPPELISYTVWLYFRFPLSLRMVEEMLAFRGIEVSYETIRQWGLKFGQEFANIVRRRLPRPGDKWHLDEGVARTHWQQWQCGAAYKMGEGPPEPAVRGRLQTASSCIGQEPVW
jgi:transposase-like protein